MFSRLRKSALLYCLIAVLLAGGVAPAIGQSPQFGGELRLARQGAWRLARRAGVPVPDDSTLAADRAACVDLQRDAWLASSRPGGLEDSLRHLPSE